MQNFEEIAQSARHARRVLGEKAPCAIVAHSSSVATARKDFSGGTSRTMLFIRHDSQMQSGQGLANGLGDPSSRDHT